MTPETTISLAFIISAGSFALAIIGSIRTRKRDEEAEKTRESDRVKFENDRQISIEKNFVQINLKLDDFKNSMKQMVDDNSKKTDELKTITSQLIQISEQIKSLNRVTEDHEQRLKDLEHNK